MGGLFIEPLEYGHRWVVLHAMQLHSVFKSKEEVTGILSVWYGGLGSICDAFRTSEILWVCASAFVVCEMRFR